MGTDLLFEIASIFFVDEYKVQVIPRAELLVDISEGGCEIESTEEQSNRYCLS